MDYNYEPPNILFLKGCFLDDCKSVEDLFDQKLLTASQADVDFYTKDIKYDKIPTVFENLDTWPKSTNIKCWVCDCVFYTRPIFIPSSIDRDNKMDTEGNFCFWGCAALYINLHYNTEERWEKHAMLRKLFTVFTGETIKEIVPAIPKTEMVQYGGKKTIKEFSNYQIVLLTRKR